MVRTGEDASSRFLSTFSGHCFHSFETGAEYFHNEKHEVEIINGETTL